MGRVGLCVLTLVMVLLCVISCRGPREYSLDVAINGSGSVSRSPGHATYQGGEEVHLAAVADPGWRFASWAGDASGTDPSITLTMSDARKVSATFAKNAPETLLDRSVTISNYWVMSLWDGTPPRVPGTLDVPAFLAQEQLPYLWTDPGFKSYVEQSKDPQGLLRFYWAAALLFHPDATVVIATLKYAETSDASSLLSPMSLFLPDLLAGQDQSIAQESAHATWMLDNGDLKSVLTTLLSQGAVPSGIPPASAHRALALLQASCPPSRQADLQTLLGTPSTSPSTGGSAADCLASYGSTITRVSDSGLASTSDANARNVAVDDKGQVYVVWHDSRLASSAHPTKKEIFLRYYDGQSWGPEQQLTFGDLESTCPSIVAKGDRAYVVYAADVLHSALLGTYTGTLSLSTLRDGKLWERKQVGDSTKAGDPDLFIDESDNLHFVWDDRRNGSPDIYYAVMQPDGTTSASERVTTMASSLSLLSSTSSAPESSQARSVENLDPSVAVDRAGNVHVVWLAKTSTGDFYAICHMMRTKEGWGALDILDTSNDLLTIPSSCIDATGVLYVAYTKGKTLPNGTYDDKLQCTTWNGHSWSAPLAVYDVPDRYADACSIAAGPTGRIHIVWSEGTSSSDMDLYYASGVAGVFDRFARLSCDDRYSGCPTIAVDAQDRTHIAWHDNHFGNYDILYFLVSDI